MQQHRCTDLVFHLCQTILTGDAHAQDSVFMGLDLAISDALAFSDDCFNALLKAMHEHTISQAAGAIKLIKIFEYNRDLLSAVQHQRLNTCLAQTYSNFADPGSLMLILELLVDGQQNPDETLRVFKTIAAKSQPPALALIPYGLLYLCKKHPGAAIAKRAKQLLNPMLNHPAAEVRTEAEQALAKIGSLSSPKQN